VRREDIKQLTAVLGEIIWADPASAEGQPDEFKRTAVEKRLNQGSRTYVQTLKEPRFTSAKLFTAQFDINSVFFKIYTTKPETQDMYLLIMRGVHVDFIREQYTLQLSCKLHSLSLEGKLHFLATSCIFLTLLLLFRSYATLGSEHSSHHPLSADWRARRFDSD
jgi:hypothetical protein